MDALDDFWESSAHKRDESVWLEKEKGLRCEQCCKLFKRAQDLKTHKNTASRCKWKEAGRAGTRAERAVRRNRAAEQLSKDGFVCVGEEELETVFGFKYLGSEYAADGDARHPVEARMQLAATAYRRLGKLWSSKTVSIQLKLRIYKATVIAVLTHGFESWNLHPKICKYLDNWNARRLAFITGREIRDENSAPTFVLSSWLQARRLKWAGALLNAEDTFLPARVAKEELKRYCTAGNTQDDYGLFKGIPKGSYKEILELATLHKEH